MSVFLIESASSTLLPFTHSVASEELAMADPQPKVLNLASSMTLGSGLIFICSLMTSPHLRAPGGNLTKSVCDDSRAEPELFQKGAHLLRRVKRAPAWDGALFPPPTIGHNRHGEARASPADGAMNANCSFICHVVCSSPFR